MNPVVSIIIPTFNKVNHTLTCLHTLNARTPSSIPTEVIVVDNASTDGTRDVLENLRDDITVILNDRNEGFGAAANTGAAVAKGEFLLFLHNDTSVMPGWLAPLYDAMMQDAALGAVQPRILYMDGRLYSGGGLIFSDECIEYGQGVANPRHEEHSSRRSIDYASSAGLLVRKSAFASVGGFDKTYIAAKYVTADLSMALASAGYKTIYEPASDMMHVGTETDSLMGETVPEYITMNNEHDGIVFSKKWAIDLMYRPKYAIDIEAAWARRSHGSLDAMPARSPIVT